MFRDSPEGSTILLHV